MYYAFPFHNDILLAIYKISGYTHIQYIHHKSQTITKSIISYIYIYICVLNHSHPSIPQLLPVNSLFLLVPICSHYFSNISPCLPHPKKCLLISPYFARSYFKQTHTSIHIHICIYIYTHIYMYTYIYISE